MEIESREVIRKQYDHSGEAYDALRTKTSRGLLLRSHEVRLFNRLQPEYRNGMQVLEVGAGSGDFTVPALKSGYHLIATDINEGMLDTLRKKVAESDLEDRCEVRVEDIFRLSFPDNHFEFVFCMHVIPRFLNTDDQRAALTELSRVVKRGGTLLFNYRNSKSPYNLVCREHATKRSEIKAILDDAGMRIDKTRVKHLLNRTLLNMLPVACGKVLSVLDRVFERFLPSLGWDIYVVARKEGARKDFRQTPDVAQ